MNGSLDSLVLLSFHIFFNSIIIPPTVSVYIIYQLPRSNYFLPTFACQSTSPPIKHLTANLNLIFDRLPHYNLFFKLIISLVLYTYSTRANLASLTLPQTNPLQNLTNHIVCSYANPNITLTNCLFNPPNLF